MRTMSELMEAVRRGPDFHKAGMALFHNGVVRETSRDGRRVSGLEVTADHERLGEIVARHQKRPGIVDVRVEINENKKLAVGDDVMFIAVAGDIREHVIPVLTDVLNEVKATVTKKTEFFV
ncbi:Molybdenum cofactor biosynthesis protein MoaE [Candidatus Desulfarcum epimagneticum]|uniref:Molybdopterin synthase catalytic subunit n=1 Tax=uncultured Desulfobacteraceae bacterium TaxID=218296 RepID=A0A484HMN9_9BACT|nr:Molybdenum cofactor biosynthesis protein MoaE [uncultured Desulfobacteraceae bacterium]